MPIKLETNLTRRLLEQPESGMGYQVVDVETRANRWLRKEAIVFNAEYLFYLHDEKEFNILSEVKSFDEIRKLASLSTDIVDLKVKSRFNIQKFSMVRESDKVGPAENAPIESTKIGEKFKRFSAFRDDHRINPDGSLKPGSYATTEEDAKNVRTGMDAVRRYALLNPAPAIYVFTIAPPEKTKIKKGIVQPQYNQPGGGVEVKFIDGTPANTVTGPDVISER